MCSIPERVMFQRASELPMAYAVQPLRVLS